MTIEGVGDAIAVFLFLNRADGCSVVDSTVATLRTTGQRVAILVDGSVIHQLGYIAIGCQVPGRSVFNGDVCTLSESIAPSHVTFSSTITTALVLSPASTIPV